MLTYQIPKTARYIQASAAFTAPLGVDTSIYDFTGQRAVLIEKLVAGSFYLIDTVSISGDLPEAAYISSLVAVPPNLILKKAIPGTINIFEMPFPVANFAPNVQIAAFTQSEIKNNSLVATLDGHVKQTRDTFGLDSITLSLSFAIYAMDSYAFAAMWNDAKAADIKQAEEKDFLKRLHNGKQGF